MNQTFLRRLSLLFKRNRFRSELDEEMAFHRAQAEQDFLAAGLSPKAAHTAAGRQFGNPVHLQERSVEIINFRFETVAQDLRFALRQLRKNPGFTLVILATLALGIGACTAIFSLVNAVLLRSLPYGDPGRLVYLYTPNPRFNIPLEVFGPSYADFYDLKAENRSFQAMTAFEQSIFNLASQGTAQRVSAAQVDGDFFSTFQVSTKLGRTISSADDQLGHEKVAIISHALWQSMFASSPDVFHQSLLLDDNRYQIIGVAPSGFEYPHATDLPYGNSQYKTTQVWIPLALTARKRADRDDASGNAVGRLKPGISIAQAQAEMATIMVRLDRLHDAKTRGWGALIENFIDSTVGHVRSLMWLLFGSVGIVLLIACGNAANLLLARGASRTRELGVRVALGAGRSRILRQLLTEAILIGAAAGAVGIGLAFLFLRLLPRLDPGNIPRLNEASLDMNVLLFTVGLSLFTSISSGILPGLILSRSNVTDFLTTSRGRSEGGAHTRVQSTFVVIESALVVVLLAGAGLLIRSYINVESVDPGFSQSTVTANIGLVERYSQPQQRIDFFRNLFARLQALPGTQAVGAINDLPLSNSESLGFFQVEGYPNEKDQWAEGRSVTTQYFSAMNIPVVAGRGFVDADILHGDLVTIINQSFASKYFANRNPIGGRINTNENQIRWSTIVGVVGDVRHSSLEEAPVPQMYQPHDFSGGYIAVRSTLPPKVLANEIRSTLHAIDPNIASGDIQTMAELVSEASARRRFQTSLLTVFAGIALVLAVVGLYGVMAYSVNRRTQEMGIRMALGAQRRDVMMLVVKKAALLLALGLVSGLVVSWFVTRAIGGFLFGVGRHDPITILSVCCLLAVSGLIAAMIPARRAASVNPVEALRSE